MPPCCPHPSALLLHEGFESDIAQAEAGSASFLSEWHRGMRNSDGSSPLPLGFPRRMLAHVSWSLIPFCGHADHSSSCGGDFDRAAQIYR